MAYLRGYDEEIARTAVPACINDGEAGVCALSLDADDVSPRVYRVFSSDMDGTKVVKIGGPRVLENQLPIAPWEVGSHCAAAVHPSGQS